MRSLSSYGTLVYHPALDRDIDELPRPWKERLFLKIKCGLIADLMYNRRWRKLIKPAQILKTPRPIAYDVALHLEKLLTWENGFYNTRPFKLKIEYVFDETGLKIRLLDWKFLKFGDLEFKISKIDFGRGHRAWLDGKVNSTVKRIERSREKKKANADMDEWFLNHAGFQEVDATATLRKYCFHRFRIVYGRFRDRIAAVQQWQRQIDQALDDLGTLRSMASPFEHSDLPYYYPAIETTATVLEAEQCYPIRVRQERGKRIFPFQSLSVNGQVVNFCGRNDSGKSTALLTATDIQIMGQCGMPVFAHNVRLSPRRHILLSFLDRTQQSTYMAKLLKDKAIVEAIKKLPAEERKFVLAVIDELGSATDQNDVLGVVKPFLAWLAAQGVSVIMSTQIPELSEFVGQSCNGENFVITTGYAVKAGIGKSEPVELARRIGFFKLLT